MYRILKRCMNDNNNNSVYQFLDTTVDGVTKPVELADDTELKEYVEDMLNNGGYSVADFLVVTLKEFSIETDIVKE